MSVTRRRNTTMEIKRERRMWLVEVWYDCRETIKLIVKDAILFLLLMTFIVLGHYVISRLPVAVDRRATLENLHFYSIVSAWLLFTITLILEIVLAIFHKVRGGGPN